MVVAAQQSVPVQSFGGIYITNPMSGLSKIGLTMEYGRRNKSWSIGANRYMGYYPGWQGFAEMRRFVGAHPRSHMFIYSKVLGGTAYYDNAGAMLNGSPVFNPFDSHYNYFSRTYTYAGAAEGIGFLWKRRRLLLSANFGVKYAYCFHLSGSDARDFKGFYIFGPGAVPEANFRIGYSLWPQR